MINFYHYLDFSDLDIDSVGGFAGECTCGDDYCRCYSILSAYVKGDQDSTKISDIVCREMNILGIENASVINRYVVIEELYKAHAFEVDSCSGYYGDEIEGISWVNESKHIAKIQEILNMSRKGRILALLELEYNYIAEHLAEMNWEFGYVDRNRVLEANAKRVEEHMYKKNKLFSYSEDFSFIHGILRKDLTIVDGHHRIMSSKQDELPVWIER